MNVYKEMNNAIKDIYSKSDDFQQQYILAWIEQLEEENEKLKECVNNSANDVLNVGDEMEQVRQAKPIDEWHEDMGNCLWWSFPIEEPPYSGSPLDNDFPNYVTHFTKIIVPIKAE
jgi:hypothetical protein